MTVSKKKTNSVPPARAARGQGGETHQVASGTHPGLTTNQGMPISDDQNSLKVGPRGPVLIEDFVLREKITHFDHERIPERVVHARGFGAHGTFQSYACHAELTRAAFLGDPELKTPVFVRFSTVAGSEGSADLARDVRGFAIKFYTEEGNYDLVANNIPVFFIQDAMKFPDLVHSVKPEPDRGFPQASSAHDTFWDFASLMPESTHMLMWAMSDRALPRSFRMMEGFGVHTFRMVNRHGVANFVKFHLRPRLGTFSVLWDEAVRINGVDPDFHRRDLWEAIESGDFPEWELSVQIFDQATADGFDFDVLDATKLIPEELVPLTPLGKLVLDRNVNSFFAETEQVAFCPSHLVPGIELSNDPLLQGRVFSYLDTQLSRLGSPNFQEIPINQPKCPWHTLQRGGHMRTSVEEGRVAYEPNSLSASSPREDPPRGFVSIPALERGEKLRVRPESFADHYSQARLFYRSLTPVEQAHIVGAFAFELGKVQTRSVRTRMLGQLTHVDKQLVKQVEHKLGMPGEADAIEPVRPARDLPASPALSQHKKAPLTMRGQKVGVLVTDGVEEQLLAALSERCAVEGARMELVAPRVGGVMSSTGRKIEVHHALSGAPSVLFDAIVVAAAEAELAEPQLSVAARDWLREAFGHLKVIGFAASAQALLKQANIGPVPAEGVVLLEGVDLAAFVSACKKHRIWTRRTP